MQPLTLGARRGHLAAGLPALEAARLNQIVAARTRVPDFLQAADAADPASGDVVVDVLRADRAPM